MTDSALALSRSLPPECLQRTGRDGVSWRCSLRPPNITLQRTGCSRCSHPAA